MQECIKRERARGGGGGGEEREREVEREREGSNFKQLPSIKVLVEYSVKCTAELQNGV